MSKTGSKSHVITVPPSFNLEKAMKKYSPRSSIAHEDTDDEYETESLAAAVAVHGRQPFVDEDTDDEGGGGDGGGAGATPTSVGLNMQIETMIDAMRASLPAGVAAQAGADLERDRAHAAELTREVEDLRAQMARGVRVGQSGTPLRVKIARTEKTLRLLRRKIAKGTWLDDFNMRIGQARELQREGHLKAAFSYLKWIARVDRANKLNHPDLRKHKGGRYRYRKRKRKTRRRKRRQKKITKHRRRHRKRHRKTRRQKTALLKKRYYGRKKGKVIPLYGHKIFKRIGRHASYIIWKTTKKNLPGKTFYGKFYTTRKAAHFQ